MVWIHLLLFLSIELREEEGCRGISREKTLLVRLRDFENHRKIRYVAQNGSELF